MAASCRGRAKAGKQLVSRVSDLEQAAALHNGRNRKMKTIVNIINLRAQTGGFKFQTETVTETKSYVARDLAVGFDRELDQTLSGRILHNFDSTQNEFEDLCDLGLGRARRGTLCVPLVTKTKMLITQDLTFPKKWELDQFARISLENKS